MGRLSDVKNRRMGMIDATHVWRRGLPTCIAGGGPQKDRLRAQTERRLSMKYTKKERGMNMK